MNERENLLRNIFGEALEIADLDERVRFLDKSCGGDAALRQEIEELLQAEAEAGEFLPEKPAANAAQAALAGVAEVLAGATGPLPAPGSDMLRDRIGRYKLLQKIGQGGCGVVYMAEQEEPVRRKVALKVIKLGMDTRSVIGRFEAERQALAMMDHPNIAKVLDGGATEAGRPYFVMELVHGRKITEYCDLQKLSTCQRLDLFIQVCQAVQHAHQKGIIHRDLKPSNILVTERDGQPVPKVIDFGIAKATGGLQLTDKTLFTEFEQFLGTPAYMSPEQAGLGKLDIDTRSDIYSLGVLLYELLTGQTPFDATQLRRSAIDEVRRIIREKDPPRPSAKLTTLTKQQLTAAAQQRQVDPQVLRRLLRGDLDQIVMKCLEKDRTRRYETANGLGRDIRRHLNNEPVVARPPSRLYEFQKTVQRHKFGFGAAAIIIATLGAGVLVSTWEAVRATRAKKEALEERHRADVARSNEVSLRERAQADELVARRRAYAADMLLCQQNLADNNLRGARRLLERQRPAVGELDLRGWEWRYLWQRCQGDALLKLDTHGQFATAASFTDADKRLVTYVGAGRVSLWNLSTRHEDAVLQSGSPGFFISSSGRLAASPAGEWIAAGDYTAAGTGIIRIWETNQRALMSELAVGQGAVAAVALSPDREWVAAFVVNGKGQVHCVYNVRTKQRVFEFPSALHAEVGGAVAFSPNGRLLSIGDEKGRVRLIEVGTWKEKVILPGGFNGSDVVTLAYSPDGRFLAAGSQYNNPLILVWDTVNHRKVAALAGHWGYITCLAFSPDGKLLASASADQTVKLWRTDTWQEADTLSGHTDEVWSVGFSSDGKQLVSAGKDGYFCVWRLSEAGQGRGSVALPTGMRRPDVAPDGKSVVALSEDHRVRMLDLSTLREKNVPPSLGSNNIATYWVSSHEILVGSQRPVQVKTWDLSGDSVTIYGLGATNDEVAGFNYVPGAHLLAVTWVDSGTGTLVLKLWDVLSHQEHLRRTFNGIVQGPASFALTRDARWFITGFQDLSVWDLRSGGEQPSFRTLVSTGWALLSDPLRVVSGSLGGPTMRVCDLTTRRTLPIETHQQVLGRVSASPHEARLLTGTIGREPIRLWDTESWNELLEFAPPPDRALFAPYFLCDGNTIAALDVDLESDAQRVRLWRAPSWAEIRASEAKENKSHDGPR